MLGKTFSFVESFSTVVNISMEKVIDGGKEYKEIIEKKFLPEIEDNEHNRSYFKDVLLNKKVFSS